jgi:ubiquinone/menaquinone biosynthesis C-methylase UbiE
MNDQDDCRRIFVSRAYLTALEHFKQTAELYDSRFPEISPVHRECLEYFLMQLGPSASVLDAACGTGRYFEVLADRVGQLLGIDQSLEMLTVARKKHPEVKTCQVPLQALRDQLAMTESFDGVMCIDALEWILRDDWPVVLEGFNNVLRSNGCIYMTVEIPGEEEKREIARPLLEGAAKGEIRVKHWYNYFPSTEDVSAWLSDAGFVVEFEKQCKYYRHLVLRKPS